MAVLSKAGCNAGLCHGKAGGKGGLSLTLRGETPQLDFRTLTADATDGRVRPDAPKKSLLLTKPTETAQSGHEGGKRFEVDSPEYRVLRDWIAAGAKASPADEPALVSIEVTPREKVVFGVDSAVQLNVIANFSDGSNRDVTRWAVYEPFNLLSE
ncbi:MAG: hypothetical protein AAF585_24325, partial [Verrucomicrobiota bacterium]